MKTLKHIFTMLTIFGLTLACYAETKKVGKYQIALKTTKADAIYAVGEKAEFILTIKKDATDFSGADLSYEISKDSVAPITKGEKKSANATETFVGTLNEAGFLKCRVLVKLPDEKKPIEMLAGAGFDPLKIQPSMPMPDDFKTFWQNQKAMLAKIPMNIVIKPCNNILQTRKISQKIKDKVDLFHITADTYNGKLDAFLAMPKNAKEKSLPAIVIPHGAGIRKSNYSTVVSWASSGFIALDFNALGINSFCSDDELKSIVLQNSNENNYRYRNTTNRDTIFFKELYLRLCRAIDVITSQPQWDGKTLVVHGTSQGGGQAIVAGALCSDKVSLVCSFVPALCDHTGVAKNRTNGWPHFIKSDKKTKKFGKYNNDVFNAVRYIDAVNFASMIKAPTICAIDFADNVCEPTSCFAAYNNISAKKELITNVEARHKVPTNCYSVVRKKVLKHAKQMRSK